MVVFARNTQIPTPSKLVTRLGYPISRGISLPSKLLARHLKPRSLYSYGFGDHNCFYAENSGLGRRASTQSTVGHSSAARNGHAHPERWSDHSTSFKLLQIIWVAARFPVLCERQRRAACAERHRSRQRLSCW